jgi:hypothetical protein
MFAETHRRDVLLQYVLLRRLSKTLISKPLPMRLRRGCPTVGMARCGLVAVASPQTVGAIVVQENVK